MLPSKDEETGMQSDEVGVRILERIGRPIGVKDLISKVRSKKYQEISHSNS